MPPVSASETVREFVNLDGTVVPVAMDLDRVDELVDDTVAPVVPLSRGPVVGDRRTRKRMETRRAILRASWRLFLTVGYDATTINDITEAADIGKGTFFAHFPRKADVALHLCQHRRDVVVQMYREGAFGQGSATSRITRLLASLADLSAQPDPEARVMATVVLRQFFAEPVLMHPYAPAIEALLAEIVAEGIADGEFDSTSDPEAGARLLYAAFYATKAAWLRSGPAVVPFDFVSRVDASARVVLRGMASARS